MIPILYEKGATTFANNGKGALADAISCVVTEERNGQYELEMEYPIDGIHYDLITYDRIIKAKPNETSSPQAFRIYYITRPLNGIITIKAEHISYQARHIPVAPFVATSAVEAFTKLSSSSVVANPFTFWTDKTTVANFAFTVPTACRTLLGGMEGSILDAYGGEYEWDNYTIKLHNNRGSNNGVKIAYGKNLIDLKQEENISNVITGIMPYWYKDGVLVKLTENVLENVHTYSYSRIIPVDFTRDFDEQPSEEQLRTAGLSYIAQSGIGLPKVSIKIEHINLGDTEEYPELKNLERISLCDTVSVEFVKLGVTVSSKVIKTVYDVLLEKYNLTELGEASSNLAKTLVEQSKTVEKATPLNYFEEALKKASEAITGNSGGHIVLYPKYNPQEILVMDTTDIATAVNVIRINNQGFGFSKNGVNGPFGSTWTIDNTLNMAQINVINLAANLITTGQMSAERIHGGELHITDNIYIMRGDSSVSAIQWADDAETRHSATPTIVGVTTPDPDSLLNMMRICAGPRDADNKQAGISISNLRVDAGPVFSINGYDVGDFAWETITDGIWTYRKWNSGFAECWATQTITEVVNTPWGTLYEGAQHYNDFPVGLFVEKPRCFMFGNSAGNSMSGIETSDGLSATRTQTYWILRPVSNTATLTFYVDIFAIGRWK